MTYNIIVRQTNANTADGYGEWQNVGTWTIDGTAEDALFYWMDEQKYEDNRFTKTGDNTYKLDDLEYECYAE